MARLFNFKNLFFFVFFIFSFLLSLQLHRNINRFDWKSEIFADKAGYYIYLPASFLYQFRYDKIPAGMDEKCGNGFQLDSVNRKFHDKYTCGVAILLTPFFLGTHLLSVGLNIPEEAGFSVLYFKMTDLAAAFYLVAGLWLLFNVLRRFYRPLVVYLSLLLLFFGTNLFYYTQVDGLMSHVFSFFLFSAFLNQLLKLLDNPDNYRAFLGMCLALALAVLIRPTNLFIASAFFFLGAGNLQETVKRAGILFRPKYFMTLITLFILVYLPQLFYWHYLSGHWFFNAYQGESFIYWNSPKLAEVWFAPLNGLFLYSPLVLMIVAAIGWMIVRRETNGIYLALLFLGISYVFASWYAWHFGCSYGQRSFVEYYTILSLPLAWLVSRIVDGKRRLFTWFAALLLLFLSYYSVRMSLHYDKCFYSTAWDWAKLSNDILKAGIFLIR